MAPTGINTVTTPAKSPRRQPGVLVRVEARKTSNGRGTLLWVWAVAALGSILVGSLVTTLSTTYLIALLAAAAVIALFLWRFGDPFIPFLVLVAAVQGGILVQLPLGDSSIQTVLPIVGGWVVLAIVIKGVDNHLKHEATGRGRYLALSLGAFAVIAVGTALAQYFRLNSHPLNRTEYLTLVQLGVLVLVAAYLLVDATRVIWMAYVTVASGVLSSALALASRYGLVSFGHVNMQLTEQGQHRISGTVIDPNYFSFQLLVPLAFVVVLAFSAKSLTRRIILWTSAAVLCAGIVSTYSAGALVGLVVVILTAVVLQLKASLKQGLIAVAFVVVLTVVVGAFVPPGYGQQVAEKYSVIQSGNVAAIGTGRGGAWEAGLRAVAKNPFFGSGLSSTATQAATAENYTQQTLSLRAAHNTYIATAVGTGVAGLIAFLVAAVSCVAALWSAQSRALERKDTTAVVATACLLTALVVTLVQGLQLDLQMEKYLWLLMGSALAVRHWRPKTGATDAALP
jgi:O-antigen ligase